VTAIVHARAEVVHIMTGVQTTVTQDQSCLPVAVCQMAIHWAPMLIWWILIRIYGLSFLTEGLKKSSFPKNPSFDVSDITAAITFARFE